MIKGLLRWEDTGEDAGYILFLGVKDVPDQAEHRRARGELTAIVREIGGDLVFGVIEARGFIARIDRAKLEHVDRLEDLGYVWEHLNAGDWSDLAGSLGGGPRT